MDSLGSIWLSGVDAPPRPPAEGEIECDVAVVGGGIAGLLAAHTAAIAGKSVVLLEADRIGHGVTGHTTGKASALQGTKYSELESNIGEQGSALYAAANEAGRARLAALIEREQIDCDWRPEDAWTYAADKSEAGTVRDEYEAARRAGLAVELAAPDELPFETHAAVRLPGQAEFNAAKFCAGLADRLTALGAGVHEHSRVTELKQRSGVASVSTDKATVVAGFVIIATLAPFADRGAFFARLIPQRSYCVACPTPEPPPTGMYINAGSPTRSIRSAPDPEGDGRLLILGGEGHRVGAKSGVGRYVHLSDFARVNFDAAPARYSWSAQDNMTLDGAPYIGPLLPGADRVWVLTGFGKWGLTNAAVAAEIVEQRLAGERHPWLDVFSASRVDLPAGAGEFLKHNIESGVRFAKDHVTRRSHPTCTHLGCKLNWNAAEDSWDCPCHGSRFSPEGKVLTGPAVRDLPKPPMRPT